MIPTGSTSSAEHPLLLLQGTAGNRAVAAALSQDDPWTGAATRLAGASESGLGARIPITHELLALIEPALRTDSPAHRSPTLTTPPPNTSIAYPRTPLRGTPFVTEAGQSVSGAHAPSGVDPNDVQQGLLGDCFLLAALIAVARTDPAAIARMIHPNGDGTYNVTLYRDNYFLFFHTGRERVTVRVPAVFPVATTTTPTGPVTGTAYAQPGDTSAVDGPELWVMLIERAYAQLHGGYRGVDAGGTARDTLTAITGQDARTHRVHNRDQLEVGSEISLALAAGHAVTAGIDNVDRLDEAALAMLRYPQVVGHHEYAVESVSLPDRSISLTNPHGVNHLRNFPLGQFVHLFTDWTDTATRA